MRYLYLLVTQIFAISALMFVQVGTAYMTEGAGLNPLIAGALAVVCILVPHLVLKVFDE